MCTKRHIGQTLVRTLSCWNFLVGCFVARVGGNDGLHYSLGRPQHACSYRVVRRATIIRDRRSAFLVRARERAVCPGTTHAPSTKSSSSSSRTDYVCLVQITRPGGSNSSVNTHPTERCNQSTRSYLLVLSFVFGSLNDVVNVRDAPTLCISLRTLPLVFWGLKMNATFSSTSIR